MPALISVNAKLHFQELAFSSERVTPKTNISALKYAQTNTRTHTLCERTQANTHRHTDLYLRFHDTQDISHSPVLGPKRAQLVILGAEIRRALQVDQLILPDRPDVDVFGHQLFASPHGPVNHLGC